MRSPSGDGRQPFFLLFSLVPAAGLLLVCEAPGLRSCLGILLVLAGAALAATRIDAGFPTGESEQPTWVRTVHGWEPVAGFYAPPRPPAPRLHPFAVAGFIGLGSSLVLVAFDSSAQKPAVRNAQAG